MQKFGAEGLFLAPEYLGNVNALSSAMNGASFGILVISWNITTFILFSKNLRFLATTSQPFMKYSINNALIPLGFLFVYFFKAIDYQSNQELYTNAQIFWSIIGFVLGLVLVLFLSFLYSFGADKRIYRRMGTTIDTANVHYVLSLKDNPLPKEKTTFRVDWFLSAKLGLRQPRDVRHYSQSFLDSVFKRHHMAAVIIISIAFLFLTGIGYFTDRVIFQIPASASIMIFFAIITAVAGAFSLFLKNWSFLFLIGFYFLLNWMYETNILDLRNKAYGLDYNSVNTRPHYDKESILALASQKNIDADIQNEIAVLNNWKKKQGVEKPVMYFINVSGGGLRSAAFTMNVLQQLDSITNGKIMHQTMLISGASGGMIGAAYFRELFLKKQQGEAINLQSKQYVDNITKDLLNPLFSSFISRDIAGPGRRFEFNNNYYSKDRAYAFERRLNENTFGILQKQLKDYVKDEENAIIPTMYFNAVINRDGRKLFIGTHPARYLMRPVSDSINEIQDVDAIDYVSLFARQQPLELSLTSAIRINATFPYVLPNVWLPTAPVIDIMDGGMRNNYGQETALRFMSVFKKWIQENTAKVVLIQIRDRSMAHWETPTETNSLAGIMTKPFLVLQNNWFKLQTYYQADQLNYIAQAFGKQFKHITFQYAPSHNNANASLNFHLTASEKKDIANALNNQDNKDAFSKVKNQN